MKKIHLFTDGIIYKITNCINNKCYIGQTAHFNRRFKDHLKALKESKHFNEHLQRSFNKYNEENFKFEIIDRAISRKELNVKEEYWIKFYNSNNSKFGYNLTKGGDCGAISKETRKKLSKSLKGHKISKETRNKISESLKGNIPWNKGIKTGRLSEEVRKTMSDSQKGHKVSEKTRRKISVGNKGKTRTKEQKEEMSRERTGRPILKARGKKRSKETRKKMSESRKGTSSTRKNKSYEEIYGEKEAISKKLKISLSKKGKSTKLKGKSYEEIYGKERANIIKNNKSKQLKGKSLEERFGKEGAFKIKQKLKISQKLRRIREKMLKNNLDKAIHLYTDGSYNTLYKKSGWGFVAIDTNTFEMIFEDCGYTKYKAESRNVDGELEAAYQAIIWAVNKGYDNIVVFHDYNGVAEWIKGNWRAKKKAARRYVRRCMKYRHLLEFVHVKGHTGNKWNERADVLAEMGKNKLLEDLKNENI